MRVSSNTLFERNVTLLGQQQTRLMQTQQQIASGRRILTAADDPVAAVRALEVSQSDAMNTQYAANRAAAIDRLSMAETNLQAVTSLLLDVRTQMVGAGDPLLNDTNRKTIANDLSGRLQELIGLANSTDGLGNYLFSGFQSRTQPFMDTPAGVGYYGDDGQRNLQVSASRQMSSSDSGAGIFMRVKNGNGTFVTQAAATNTGGGTIGLGDVINPALLTGHSYQVDFAVVAGVTTYSVTDNSTASAVIPAGTPYVSGQAISFDGIQFDIQGAPANGDRFTVSPSSNESVFKTISNLIDALNTPVAGANLANSLKNGIHQLDNALDNILNFRASIGLRLNEVDALNVAGDDLSLQLKQSLSKLQDVDYNKAIADLTQQQVSLEIAQKSFIKVTELSLFSYL